MLVNRLQSHNEANLRVNAHEHALHTLRHLRLEPDPFSDDRIAIAATLLEYNSGGNRRFGNPELEMVRWGGAAESDHPRCA